MSVKRIKFKNLNGFGDEFTSSPETSPAVHCLNLRAEGDALKDGFCISAATFTGGRKLYLPEDVAKDAVFISHTEEGERILFAGEGMIYSADPAFPEQGFAETEVTYTGKPFAADIVAGGNRYTAIADSSGTLTLFDGLTFTEGSCPEGAVALNEFFGRLVIVTENAVYLSAEGEPLNFTELSGSYTFGLPGGIHAGGAALFGNEIIIAGTRGMCRLVRSEFGGSFTVRPIFSDGERLLPETVAAGAEYVYVMTERGLARYNGTSVIFSHKKTDAYATEGVCGFIWNGEYHACIKSPQNANKHVVLSFGEDVCNVSEVPLVSVAVNSGGERSVALSYVHGFICSPGGTALPPVPMRRIVTASTDFGIGGNKVITEFSLYSEKDVRLVIDADGKRRLYRIVGGKGMRTVRPHLCGRIFSFSLTAEGNGVKIRAPQVEIDY